MTAYVGHTVHSNDYCTSAQHALNSADAQNRTVCSQTLMIAVF